MHPETADLVLAAAEPAALPPDGAPDWVHLLPAGTVRGVDGRGPYTLADAAAVIAASLPAGGRPLPVDYDHATDRAAPEGRPAPAAGWITALDARPDGVWGRVEWTERGRQAVAGREWRFISPVFRHLKDAAGTVRQVLRAALTNAPNLGGLAALASQDFRMDKTFGDLAVALGLAETTPADQLATHARQTTTALAAAEGALTRLRAALKLPADAAPDAIVTAVAAAVDRSGDTAVAALHAQLTDVQTRLARMTSDECAARVEELVAGRRIVPAARAEWLALAMEDRGRFDRMSATLPELFPAGSVMPGGSPPAGGEGLTADEVALCSQLGLDPAAYRKTRDAERAAR